MTDGQGFESDGLAVLRGFFDDPMTRELGMAVDAALATPAPAGCARPHNTLVPLRWNDPIVARVLGTRALVERIVSAVSADDLRWISGYVSVKDPRSAALWWHQDWWCWKHPISSQRRASQIAVLGYLSDTDEVSGALRFIPGSHRQSTPLHALLPEAHTRPEDELDVTHPVVSDQPEQLTLTASAGDAIVIDYRLLHGTHPNRQPRRRDCLILNFTPSWRTLPVDIRAHLIRHPAQPTGGEQPGGALQTLLPRFSGRPRDLPLSRDAPVSFATA